jgi:excisionase family DNA binding protein
MEPQPDPTAPLLHDVAESCRLLGGISRPTLYRLIRIGDLNPVKIGARTYISHDELMRYVEKLGGKSNRLKRATKKIQRTR